jgi:hypothetical protein
MKHLFAAAVLATVAFFGLVQSSQAHGGLFRSCGGCDSGCAPCVPVEVKYEERKVTCYKQVMKEKEIEVLQCKRVMTPEKYFYTVCVPVTKEEKRKVIVCTPVMKEVEYTCTVMVPKTIEKKVMCTTYTCEKVMIVEKVPVCKLTCVTCVDECGRCHRHLERVTCIEERTRCVIKKTPVYTEQIVKCVICEPVLTKAKKMVCEIVRTEKEEIVKVCSFIHEKKEGTRMVCSTVTEKVKTKVSYCEMVPYETTVKVAICPPAACSDCGYHRVSFFRRGCN